MTQQITFRLNWVFNPIIFSPKGFDEAEAINEARESIKQTKVFDVMLKGKMRRVSGEVVGFKNDSVVLIGQTATYTADVTVEGKSKSYGKRR